jgi:hypothetical protein
MFTSNTCGQNWKRPPNGPLISLPYLERGICYGGPKIPFPTKVCPLKVDLIRPSMVAR